MTEFKHLTPDIIHDPLSDVRQYLADPSHRDQFESFAKFYDRRKQSDGHHIIGLPAGTLEIVVFSQAEPSYPDDPERSVTTYDILSRQEQTYAGSDLQPQQLSDNTTRYFGDSHVNRVSYMVPDPINALLTLSNQSIEWSSPTTGNRPVPLRDIHFLDWQVKHEIERQQTGLARRAFRSIDLAAS